MALSLEVLQKSNKTYTIMKGFYRFSLIIQTQLFAGKTIFSISRPAIYISRPAMYIPRPAIYISRPAIEFWCKGKNKNPTIKIFSDGIFKLFLPSIAFVELFCCNCISEIASKTCPNALILRRMRVKPRLQQILRKICTPLAH